MCPVRLLSRDLKGILERGNVDKSCYTTAYNGDRTWIKLDRLP